jgi:hypothetical protein
LSSAGGAVVVAGAGFTFLVVDSLHVDWLAAAWAGVAAAAINFSIASLVPEFSQSGSLTFLTVEVFLDILFIVFRLVEDQLTSPASSMVYL